MKTAKADRMDGNGHARWYIIAEFGGSLCGWYTRAIAVLEERIMWHLWRFCPRPLLQPWKWSWRYYAWRMETYSGIPMHEVTWRTFIAFLRQPQQRRAMRRYARWVGRMHRIRRV